MQLGATCFCGLSDLLEQESRALGWSEARAVSDELVVGAASAEIRNHLVSELRIARRILHLACWGQFDGIDSIRAACEQLEWSEFLDPTRSFGVLGERVGHHDFTSEVLGRELGSCVRRWFKDRSHPVPPVNLKSPQQTVFAVLRDRNFFVGVDVAGELDRRLKRPFQHHAPLNPTIAVAMLRLSSFASSRFLLDPMCGTGTIVIEAALLAKRLSPNAEGFRIIAGERFRTPFEGMLRNLAAFDVAAHIETHCQDAATLDYIAPGDCPLVVVNPPYGLRMGDPRDVDRLYRDFAKAAADRGVAEIVAITTRKRSWSEGLLAAGFTLTHMRPVTYGRLAAWVMVHRLSRAITV